MLSSEMWLNKGDGDAGALPSQLRRSAVLSSGELFA